jgi:AraC family transcriptional regulator, positive regulator of tynA and feaB
LLQARRGTYKRDCLAGQSALAQNDQTVQLAAGDIAIVDAARSVTYFTACASAQWLALRLPRQSVLSYLGFELQGGLARQGARAGTLFDLVRDADKGAGPASVVADSYLQLAIYDLVGALFVPSDWPPVSRLTDKLFARIGSIIRERLADPDFGPVEVAAATGISLRYVQKLCTARGTTCSELIYSLRLDHALIWCVGGRCWARAVRSATSPMPAAFATMPISSV